MTNSIEGVTGRALVGSTKIRPTRKTGCDLKKKIDKRKLVLKGGAVRVLEASRMAGVAGGCDTTSNPTEAITTKPTVAC